MEYLFKSSGLLIIFYLCYKLFLNKETFFTSNRWFFLIGIISSLLVPLLVIPIYIETEPVLLTNQTFNITPSNLTSQVVLETFDWIQFSKIIYLTVVVLLVVKLAINLISLLVLISKHDKKKKNGYYLIETTKDINPFSFFNFIVLNPNKYKNEEIEQIIMHEKAHVNQFHSIDIIISQVVSIIVWFNPIVWLYKKEIEQNLEFIADKETLQKTNSKKAYQHLLIKTSVAKGQLALINNFNNSFIKKRITMLGKNKSKSKKHWKYTLIIPFIVGFIFLFNTEIIAQEKVQHLQNRYNGVSEIITKNSTKKELQNIKNRLESSGVGFNYSNLKRNKKNEIIQITIKVRNKKSSASATWGNNGKPIPKIEAGTNFDNNVIARSISSRPTVVGVKSVPRKSSSVIYFDKLNILQKDIINEINALISLKKLSFFVKDNKIVSESNFKKLGNKNIKTLQYLESEEAIAKHGQKAKNGAIIITTKTQALATSKPIKIEKVKAGKISTPEKALYIINKNIIISKQDFDKVDRKHIKSISIMKPQSAVAIYGERAKYGAVIIHFKKGYIFSAKKVETLGKLQINNIKIIN